MILSESEALLPRDWLVRPISELARLCPVQEVNCSALAQADVKLVMKREDRMHTYLTGNKLYKLYYPLRDICSRGSRRVLTFGGAYSNHLVALAYAGRCLGLEVWGVVRGERPATLSPTLADAVRMGMRLHFVTRHEYRARNDPAFREQMVALLGEHDVIAEGGDSENGSLGCKIWAQASIAMCGQQPDAICMACGTGGTAAGVLAGADGVPVFGYLVLKGRQQEIDGMNGSIIRRAAALQSVDSRPSKFVLETDFHGGGYGRLPLELKSFMKAFETETGIPLDPVYTAKLVWGVIQGVRSGKWSPGSVLLLLHSGGLQGRRGFQL